MHAAQLLRAVDHGGEADAVLAHRGVEPGIRAAGHRVGGYRQAGEGIPDDLLHPLEGLAVDIHRGCVVVAVEHVHLQAMLFRNGFRQLQAFLRTLVGNEAHVRPHRGGLGQHIVGIGAGLHRKGHGGFQHGPGLGADGGHNGGQKGLKEPQVAEKIS